MFTNLFNEEEKKNFLELVYRIASCDGEYEDEEKELVNSYKKELGIDTVPDTSSMDQLISYFSDKSESLKRIVFFELYGMVMADGKIDNEESAVVEEIEKKFNLGESVYTKLIDAAHSLQTAYDKVYNAVF